MEPGLLATAKEFISGYWPHVSGGAVAAAATVGTAIFAYIRRPKSSPTDTGPYFTEAALLSPPLTRPAYSDRMAYVLAEMSDLAYYQFEGQRGFVDDAVENAMSLDLTDDTNVRELLEKFSTELMSGRKIRHRAPVVESARHRQSGLHVEACGEELLRAGQESWHEHLSKEAPAHRERTQSDRSAALNI